MKIVSKDEAETADYVITATYQAGDPLLLADNITDKCCKCGGGIQLRPDAPVKPKRVCLPCGMVLIEEAEAAGKPHAGCVS